MAQSDVNELPAGLPVPLDDGAAAHLVGMQLPSLPLPSTFGGPVDPAAVPGRIVVFCYPRTGTPGQIALVDNWDTIPGARGCTPQACSYRDQHREFDALGVTVFGLSTQDVAYQREMAERLHLPYAILSDAGLHFTRALKLPAFIAANVVLLKRLTLVANQGKIEKVFYPVFPPDRSAAEVLEWLRGPGAQPAAR